MHKKNSATKLKERLPFGLKGPYFNEPLYFGIKRQLLVFMITISFDKD